MLHGNFIVNLPIDKEHFFFLIKSVINADHLLSVNAIDFLTLSSWILYRHNIWFEGETKPF